MLPRHHARLHCGVCPSVRHWYFLLSKAWIGSSHIPSCNPSHSCFAAHFSQQIILAGFRSIFFHVLRADHSPVYHHMPSQNQGVPLRPLEAQITGLAHDGSCRTSRMSPCLHFKDLIPPCLLLFFSPFFLPDPSVRVSVAMVESSSRLFTSMKSDSETDSFAAAAVNCLLNFSLSVGAMPTACPPHDLAGAKPVLNNFLTPVLMSYVWKTLFS